MQQKKPGEQDENVTAKRDNANMGLEFTSQSELTFNNKMEKLLNDMEKYFSSFKTNNFSGTSVSEKDMTRLTSHASGTYTESFSAFLDVKGFDSCNLYLTFTGSSGASPSLKVTVYDYVQGRKFYLGEFEEFTTYSTDQNRLLQLDHLGQFLFFEFTITDSVSFQFKTVGKIK